ncbi:hypothetical protein ACFV2S_10795 [Streptomyces sp. NPDC059695]|uniref:hypothetical protein n=1 Tax=Streptomyces sp. NPDC059695 TaxID=3346910 RepID=UPI0036CF5BBE
MCEPELVVGGSPRFFHPGPCATIIGAHRVPRVRAVARFENAVLVEREEWAA